MARRPHVGPDRRRTGETMDRDERFRQLVELAPDGLLIHDGETIAWANAAALRMAGATDASDLVGQPIGLVLDPPHLKAVAGHLAGRLGASAPATPVRDTLRRLDGTSMPVEVRAIVFLHRGAPAVHLVLRDISERLQLEETARRVEDHLQQVMRAESLGRLAGGVAHELNNMIAIVLGHGAFVLDDRRAAAVDRGDVPGDVRADVREMMRAAERAAKVTRQLLAFSQHALHRPDVVDLAMAVRDMEPALRQLLGPGRTLEIKDDPARARVDPSHLAQVLMELASNARDATTTAGHVRIAVGITELAGPVEGAGGRTIPPGRYAEISIADDGADIDETVQARMFEPFFTTKPPGEGAGLGLAAVQGILAQNGASIRAESTRGAGATFRVFFPELNADGTATGRSERRRTDLPARRRTRSVLIVDDEPAIRAVVARILREAGVESAHAADGVEALAAIERDGPPDLVITDLQMPRMGGLALRRAIQVCWSDLPVLLMSGYSGEYLKLDGSIDEAEVVLQKPFTAGELMARVAPAVGITGRAGTSPSA